MKILLAVLVSGLLGAYGLGVVLTSAIDQRNGSAKQQPSSITLATGSDTKLGGTVKFTVVYPQNVKGASVQVTCYQEGAIIWARAAYADRTFVLGGESGESSPWQQRGGPAHCKADLYYWSQSGKQMVILAGTEFDAAGAS